MINLLSINECFLADFGGWGGCFVSFRSLIIDFQLFAEDANLKIAIFLISEENRNKHSQQLITFASDCTGDSPLNSHQRDITTTPLSVFLKIVRLIGPTDCSPINSIKVSPSVGLYRRVFKAVPLILFCKIVKSFPFPLKCIRRCRMATLSQRRRSIVRLMFVLTR